MSASSKGSPVVPSTVRVTERTMALVLPHKKRHLNRVATFSLSDGVVLLPFVEFDSSALSLFRDQFVQAYTQFNTLAQLHIKSLQHSFGRLHINNKIKIDQKRLSVSYHPLLHFALGLCHRVGGVRFFDVLVFARFFNAMIKLCVVKRHSTILQKRKHYTLLLLLFSFSFSLSCFVRVWRKTHKRHPHHQYFVVLRRGSQPERVYH